MDTSKFLDLYYLPDRRGIAIAQTAYGLFAVILLSTDTCDHLAIPRIFDSLEGAQRYACREASAAFRTYNNNY